MAATDHAVRVGIFGSGGWARRTHIPNLLKLDGVEVVAVCDISADAAQQAASEFGIASSYSDGYEMVDDFAP